MDAQTSSITGATCVLSSFREPAADEGTCAGLFVTGYESLIDAVRLPDLDDRHVLAAAIRSNANFMVTFNLHDFPVDALEPFGIEAVHPDDFLALQFEIAPNIVCVAAKRHRASLRNPPTNVDEYLATLEAQGLLQTASKLRAFGELI